MAPGGQARRRTGLVALRVLHCPWDVGGHAAGLAAAERALGIDSRTVVFTPSRFGYPVDEVVWDSEDRPLVLELKRWRLLARALHEFDVVHFNFGSTIAPQRIPRDGLGIDEAGSMKDRAYRVYSALFEQCDLSLLSRAGKGVFVTFQGDDARQGDLSAGLRVNGAVEAAPGHYTPASDADKRRRIARFARRADGIYALNPDLLHVLPQSARFLPYANVDPRAWEPRPSPPNGRPLVLHAPTNRQIKGTRFLCDAVSRLRADGVGFDFELVEGLSRADARERYARADLVVDQLLLGWYGGVAVEAMALGIPVLAYLRDDDLSALPAEMRTELPVIRAEPTTIYRVLKELLTKRRAELPELGARGRAYVMRWHDPRRIAQEVVRDYDSALAARSRHADS
jgi:glycosyltransferase involved in cell wall biosynthesis